MWRGVAALALCLLAACGGSQAPAKEAPRSPSANRPTRDQCERTVAHLRTMMPAAFDPDPEKDIADCLELPAEVVTCYEAAASPDDADACTGSR